MQRDLSPRGRARRKRRDARPVASGERARIVASGTVGVVRETRDDRVTLEVGGIKLQVPREEIEPLGEHVPAEVERDATPSIAGWTELDLPAGHEVDLRGLRVEEVDLKLGRALDAAVVQGLSEIRIIHGLGTGAVKARVREILSSDERIESSRPGGQGAGGAGVTVAVLR